MTLESGVARPKHPSGPTAAVEARSQAQQIAFAPVAMRDTGLLALMLELQPRCAHGPGGLCRVSWHWRASRSKVRAWVNAPICTPWMYWPSMPSFPRVATQFGCASFWTVFLPKILKKYYSEWRKPWRRMDGFISLSLFLIANNSAPLRSA